MQDNWSQLVIGVGFFLDFPMILSCAASKIGAMLGQSVVAIVGRPSCGSLIDTCCVCNMLGGSQR